MKKYLVLLAVCLTIFFPNRGMTQEKVEDYLILEDIGHFIVDSKPTVLKGGVGVLGATGHYVDHEDITYDTGYIKYPGGAKPITFEEADSIDPELVVEVQVTQHSGSDSDRWLLHEVERGFRRGDYEENMTSSRFRSIDGSNIFYSGLGGGTYRWLSNNVLVSINYTDLYKQKSEPIEVVKAYLAKFPSTISAITINRSHNEQWIKDEMDRRLWLVDKWFAQLQVGNIELTKVLMQSVKHMNVFLDYREKYYGIASTPEKKSLWEYLQGKDGTSIRNKLVEYKTWWAANKAVAINIP